jgi:lysophospholipase L1-like esterase
MKSSLPRESLWPLAVLAGLLLAAAGLKAQTARDVSQWEPEITAFEASDKTNPPPKHAILFVGSSSIRMWKTLAKDFPDKQVINRGFGGSHIADSTALAERIIFPYEPKQIVFYAGDNDLAEGRTVDQVVADYEAFLKKVREKLPDTTIAYISIKPSVLRWSLKEKMEAANAKIAAIKGDKLKFVDVYHPMLGEDGQPLPDIFVGDRLHMNAKGYEIWVPLVGKQLE